MADDWQDDAEDMLMSRVTIEQRLHLGRIVTTYGSCDADTEFLRDAMELVYIALEESEERTGNAPRPKPGAHRA